jgi:uncharacterized membrane protein
MLAKLVLYVISIAVFLACDAVWLGVVAKDMYKNAIGHLMAEKVNWGAAALFYVLFLVGLAIFAVQPGVRDNDWRPAALYGALYGFFTYLTYDMTNLATLQGFPVKVVIIDLAWGTALSAIVAALTIVIGKLVLGDLSG